MNPAPVSDIEALLQQGIQQHKQGELAQAEQYYRRVLEQQPENAAAAHYLGLIARESGKLETACQFFHQALAHSERDAVLHYNLALTRQQLGQAAAAIHHYRQALVIKPDFPQAYNNLGVLLNEAGEHAAAAKALRQALQQDPRRVESFYNLVYTQRFASLPEESTQMQHLLAEAALAPQARLKLHFALGKLHDDVGQYATAFEHYRQGNALKQARFDGERFTAFVSELMAVFSAEFFARRQDFGEADSRPTFIVGMPRSGTTLVEQILVAHPLAHSAGELDYMQQIAAAMPRITGQNTPSPQCFRQLDRATARTLALDYLQQRTAQAPAARCLIDKTPLNFIHLGLIALLFPRARIIHLRRDARDTCLSCYFHNFSHSHDFSYSLEHLGLFHGQYQRLMQHWQEVLPLDIHHLDYEALVESPAEETARLLAYCQLPEPEAALDHTANPHASITTASLYQARQPVYRHAVQRWRHYRDFIQPLENALPE